MPKPPGMGDVPEGQWRCCCTQGTGDPETRTGLQAVTRAVTTRAFFLCEGLLGQHFNVVPDGTSSCLWLVRHTRWLLWWRGGHPPGR